MSSAWILCQRNHLGSQLVAARQPRTIRSTGSSGRLFPQKPKHTGIDRSSIHTWLAVAKPETAQCVSQKHPGFPFLARLRVGVPLHIACAELYGIGLIEKPSRSTWHIVGKPLLRLVLLFGLGKISGLLQERRKDMCSIKVELIHRMLTLTKYYHSNISEPPKLQLLPKSLHCYHSSFISG